MSTLREAAQQALEALEFIDQALPWPAGKEAKVAITALRAALAEFNPDWDRIEPLQENLREHMAEIQRLRAQRDALLEALKNIVKEFKAHGRQHWPEAVKARAAIAKAEENNT